MDVPVLQTERLRAKLGDKLVHGIPASRSMTGPARLASPTQNRLAGGMTARQKPKRTRTNDPASTRSRVLDAAVELFHRQGYADTSMQEITQSAGVTSGALHHHYPTKKDLGLAVIRERVATMVADAWVTPVTDAKTADKGVVKAFKDIIGGLREGSIVGCPLNNLALELAYAEPDLRIEIQQIFDDWQAALASSIRQSKLVGPGSGMTADELATFIIAAYSGAMTMAKTSQSAQPLNVTLKLLTRLWRKAPVQARASV
jgi:TetR/AcrR family transcriptional repressor of nem operon